MPPKAPPSPAGWYASTLGPEPELTILDPGNHFIVPYTIVNPTSAMRSPKASGSLTVIPTSAQPSFYAVRSYSVVHWPNLPLV